jgi:hypothetical protein
VSAPERIGEWGKKVVDTLAVGIPIAVITKVYGGIADGWISQPREAFWVLLPLSAAALAALWIVRGSEQGRMSPASAVFLCLYVSLFTLAGNFGFLDWSRDLTLFGDKAPASRVTPSRLGDWRYAVQSRTPHGQTGIAIVTVPPVGGRSLDEIRREIAWFIGFARNREAKGIAFDFYLRGESPDFDRLICHAVSAAPFPVLFGYGFQRNEDRTISALPTPATLKPCIRPEAQGHLAGFVGHDGVLRDVPLFFNGDRDLPALSWRIAEALSGGNPPAAPGDGLLRYVEPRASHTAVRWEDLQKSESARNRIARKFVIVGEDSDRERFPTPFGPKLGVAVHADAAESLLRNTYLRKNPWWFAVALILLACYPVMLAAEGKPMRAVFRTAALASAAVIALSAAAAYALAAWVDVVYPLLAVWMLVPLLRAFRARSLRGKAEGA